MPKVSDAPVATKRRRAVDIPRSTLTPEHWVEAATALLVDKGIDSVRVDVVAKQLGVTRGSFYWHFRDRDDLLQALLTQWRDTATELLIQRFEHQTTDPRVLVRELISLPFRGRAAERAAGIELAIRAWARRDRNAQHAVDEVDSRRIAYIAQCFSALGFSIAQARSRGFALYAWEVGESLLGRQGSVAQRQERGELVEALVMRPETARMG
jgi:AcrR family transcriptional regulator